MTAKSFRPGKNNYDRVMWCLGERLGTLQLLVALYRKETQVEIEFPEAVEVVRYVGERTVESIRGLALPALPWDCEDEQRKEFFEWAGLLSCRATELLKSTGVDRDYALVCKHKLTLPYQKGGVECVRYRGFMGPDVVLSALAAARYAFNYSQAHTCNLLLGTIT